MAEMFVVTMLQVETPISLDYFAARYCQVSKF